MQRAHADRFQNAHFLTRAPHGFVHVRARNARLERHHRLERPGRVIRSLRHFDPRIEEAPHREHVLQPLGAVVDHLLPVIVDVSREWIRDGAERADARDEVVVDDSAVLETETRVLAGQLPLDALEHAQRDVDPDIPIGVDSDLPARLVRFARLRVELAFLGHEDAVVVGASDEGLAEPRRALRDRAVAKKLHRPDFDPFVPESRSDPGLDHRVEILHVDECVDA